MAKTKDQKEAVEDVYLDAVMGNILDHYENTSYNLKLYMIGEEEWLKGQYAAEPNRTVVIAQTGVTGVQIDNLSLDIVKNSSTGNSMAVRASFTLFQPSAADLLDQIQAAKLALGHKYMFADVPLFLAIEFKGYQSSIDQEDDASLDGKPVISSDDVLNEIAGPFIYRLQIADVSVAIDSTGSTYEFACPVGSSSVYTDEYFKLPKDLKVQGNNIKDMVQDLQDQLKKYREDNLKAEEFHDEIVFDLSQVEEALEDLEVTHAGVKAAEEVNRLINAQEQGVKTLDEYRQRLEDNPDSFDSGVEAGTDWLYNQNINMKEGTSINQFFTTLFVMCNSFLDKVSRKKVFNDPEIDENGLDLNKTFTKWYKIEASLSYELDATGQAEFDRRRGKYAKKVIYKPIVYDTANPNQQVSDAENNLSEDQTTKRIKEMNIKKAYHYLYTGLNDQVLSADIKYDAGITLLQAPGGGYMGDMSTNANNPTMNNADDTDGKTRNAEVAAKQEDPSGIQKALKEDANFQGRIKNELNLTDAEFAEVMKDEQKQRNLAETILYVNNNGKDPLGYRKTQQGKADFPVDTPPANPNAVPYKPEASGYLYSADLLEDYGGSETVIGELAGGQALALLNQAVRSDKDLDVAPRAKNNYGTHVVATGGQTNDGTASATLFGYMYNNVNDAGILIDLGLKVRGDPWYLGQPMTYAEARAKRNPGNSEANTEEQVSQDKYIVYGGADNYFLFTMQTPRVRDPDVDIEDNNTGYMSRQGTAFFISGVYQIVGVTANFSGGLFDIELTKAPKVTSLSLSKIDITGN